MYTATDSTGQRFTTGLADARSAATQLAMYIVQAFDPSQAFTVRDSTGRKVAVIRSSAIHFEGN